MLRLTGAAGSIALVAGCGGPEGEDGGNVPAEEATGNGQEQNEGIGAGNGNDSRGGGENNESDAGSISGGGAENDTEG